MKRNAFYKELKDFVKNYHPELLLDEDFLQSRSENAEQTFINCSSEGMNLEQSREEANTVLYAGLEFSTFALVEDIIEEQFRNLNFSDTDKFAMQMYLMLQPVFVKYNIGDDFDRSSAYDELYNEITGYIDDYVRKNELQQANSTGQ